jgi:hypothetical protein
MANRTSQVVTEALTDGTSNARVSQVVTEALTDGTSNARVSQVVVMALTGYDPNPYFFFGM